MFLSVAYLRKDISRCDVKTIAIGKTIAITHHTQDYLPRSDGNHFPTLVDTTCDFFDFQQFGTCVQSIQKTWDKKWPRIQTVYSFDMKRARDGAMLDFVFSENRQGVHTCGSETSFSATGFGLTLRLNFNCLFEIVGAAAASRSSLSFQMSSGGTRGGSGDGSKSNSS